MFRCLAKKCFVEIDDLFRLMIEEIQLGARNSELAEHLEELLTRFRRPQLVGMLPEPYGYALLSRVLDHLPAFLGGPLPPDAFDDVMFEAEFARHA